MEAQAICRPDIHIGYQHKDTEKYPCPKRDTNLWSHYSSCQAPWVARQCSHLKRPFYIRYPCWRRVGKISWTDSVKNGKVLHRIKEDRYILQTIKTWTANDLRRNCLLKHVIEGKIEGRIEATGRRVRIRKQLLDDFKQTRGYLKLKEEALDYTAWRTRFQAMDLS
jgi:hypothetical protein